MTMRIALTAWGINPCGYINIAYMPKSASGTTSTQCQGTAPGMPCCHSYPDTGDQAVRMGRWFVSMARANCTSIALMHALNRYNIYIHTPFSPMHMLFSFYLLLHSWPGLSHFLLHAGYDPSVWPRPSAAAATAQAPPGVPLDHLPLQRRLAAIMEVLEVSRIDSEII